MSKRYQGGILGVGFNPLRAPNAPTVGTATAGSASATVAFTAPACTGGSAVTGYTAQSNPGGFSGAAVGSPITVSGLSNGTAYTFGVFALNSYGPSPISAFSNSVTPALPDGTFGVFALGNVGCTFSTVRNKYTYAGCVVGSATAATTGSYFGSAAGNSTVGIFALGQTSLAPAATCARNKYTYSGDTVSAGGAARFQSQQGYATGNSTIGIFALGSIYCCGGPYNAACRDKYTYSGDVVATASSATVVSRAGAAVGNSTVGIFAIGLTGSVATTTRNKYTYAGDVVSAGGAATATNAFGSAAGNSTTGIFAFGCSGAGRVSTRNKYTYSGCVVSAGGAATAASREGSAAGNSTVGIFALGNVCLGAGSTIRNRYTYSGDVVAAGGAATVASKDGAAASNGINGITL